MSRVPDKKVERGEPSAAEPGSDTPGIVVVDSRGHSVWQWAKDVIENTSVLLKRLENKDLALESTQKTPVLPGQEPGEKGASPEASKRADSNSKSAKEAASKSAHFHPATRPDQNRDRGGWFDPYNAR